MSLLIVGCGYVGEELVRWLRSQPSRENSPIFALTRSQQRVQSLVQLGVQPLMGHWLQPESLPKAPQISHVLVSVPHRADATARLPEDSDQYHILGIQNLLDWFTRCGAEPTALRLIYLSTTGVFGQFNSGEWVSETTPVSASRPGPAIAVAAENWLDQNRHRWPSTVLRLSGIYGPGRVPLIGLLKSGQTLAVPREGYLNLIHVTDAARAIAWLMTSESVQPVYLLSDGKPVQREEFYRYLALQCGVSEPVFVEPDQSDSRRRRATDKRIDSSLFWRESGLQPMFPDYRAGLRTAVEQAEF